MQLATLAHIRHTHTRYDDLLRETNWHTARKVIEQACLDKIVKWRGDEETGRDQLDEILQEVVVISDSEEEESESEDTSPDENSGRGNTPLAQTIAFSRSDRSNQAHMSPRRPGFSQQQRMERAEERKNRSGFKRYRAFNEAIRRNEETPIGQSLNAQPPPRSLNPQQIIYISNHGDNQPDGGRGPIVAPEDPRLAPRHAYLSSYHSNSASPVQPGHDTFSIDRRQPPASASTFSTPPPTGAPIQEWLVPSIESPSPEVMKPAFIRPVPPRNTDREDFTHFDGHAWDPMDSRTWPTRDHGQDSPRNRGFQPSHGRPTGMYHAGPMHEEHVHPRASDIQIPADSMSRLELAPRFEEPPRRIVVESGRLGDRNNPIVMEDRGGFFERVAPGPGMIEAMHQDPRDPVYRRPFSGPVAHRVVSSEEGSRILRESHGQDVEIIPKSRMVPSPLYGGGDHSPRSPRPQGSSRGMYRDPMLSYPDRMDIEPPQPAPKQDYQNSTPAFWKMYRTSYPLYARQ